MRRFARSPAALAIGALALLAWVQWAGQPVRTRGTSRAPAVPETLGLWSGRPLEVEPGVSNILQTDEIAVMEYHLGQEPPVWLTQVGGFGNRTAFHPPEVCYVGDAFEVMERQPMTVMVQGEQRRLMRLVIGRGGRRFESWYWFTASGRVTPSYYQQQLWFVWDAIHRKPVSGTLVRISTPLDQPQSAHRRLLTFLTSFERAVPLRSFDAAPPLGFAKRSRGALLRIPPHGDARGAPQAKL